MKDSFVSMICDPAYDELLIAIKEGFSHLSQPIPTVTLELVGPVCREPYVKGDAEDEWCWVSIYEQPVDVRIPDSMKYIGAVSTRGDDLFAAMVTYALCRKFGETIDDNAGYLNAGQEFTLVEFEEVLQAKLCSRALPNQ